MMGVSISAGSVPWDAFAPRGDIFSVRAEDVHLITQDGSNRVSQHLSQRGDGVCTAAGAQRPLWIAEEPLFGGAPCLHFDASGVYYDIAGTTADLAAGTVVAVVALDTLGGNRPIHSDMDLSAPGGGVTGQLYVNNTPTASFLNSGGAPTFFAATSTTPLALTPYHIVTTWTATTRRIWVNGDPSEGSDRAANIRRLPRGTLGRGAGPAYLLGKLQSIDIYSNAEL